MSPSAPKWQVLSWTSSEVTVVGIYHDKTAAIAAVQDVSLTDGTIGAGIVPLVGSESMEYIQGTAAT